MPVETATTELVRLPGLDVAVNTERPEAKPGHWIERGPLKRLMVFSGRSHPELALRIAEQLGVELGEVELKTFSNGETYCRYNESIRGADVFIVQTGSAPVDSNLMELLLMIQAAKLASAKRITAVVPWFPYSKQDRKAQPREPISSRLVADMIQLAGRRPRPHDGSSRGSDPGVLHDPGRPHDRRCRCSPATSATSGSPEKASYPSPRTPGRAKHATRFAEMIEADFAMMHKTRPEHEKVSVTEITGRVKDKIAIVGDDFSITGGTLLAGAQVLREHGATAVWIFITHGPDHRGRAGEASVQPTSPGSS